MWGSNPRHALPKIRFRNLLYFSSLINQFTIIFALFGTLVVQLSEQIAQENTKLFVSISICYRRIGETLCTQICFLHVRFPLI